jgi:hypothetical protein
MWASSSNNDSEQLYDEIEKLIKILHENQGGNHVRSHTNTKFVHDFLITPPPPHNRFEQNHAIMAISS